MKILIADKLAPHVIESLSSSYEVAHDSALKDNALKEALQKENPTVLVVRSTKVNGEMLSACSGLELVIRAGAGVNTIDVACASRRGIFVANCPGKNSVAVAELVMGLLLALDRNIPDNVRELRDGKWNKKTFGKTTGLKGRTLGLIGLGNIGKEVAVRASAFGLRVLACSRSLNKEKAEDLGISYAETAYEVANNSDIVSVHLALNDETKGFCDKAFFSQMKDGAIFINTSRGGVVDESALLDALENKGIRAGLDVYPEEPSSSEAAWESTLGTHPQVYGTHHIGASTAQAETATGEEVARIIRRYSSDGTVENCVNKDTDSPATYTLTLRHLNRVGVLANVLDKIRRAELNVLDMSNLIFKEHQAAVASIQVNKKPSEALITEIRKLGENILSVTCRKL